MEKKNYSYDEAYGESLKYFQGDELAARVWVNKYAVKDSFGNIYEKSPEDMHWRIANEVARIEAKYPNPLSSEELFGLLDHFKYIVPQGSPMTGIGNNYQVASLSNCFVIGVDGEADSYGGIFKIDEEQVQLMKRRGGVGHDLSHIRPKGSPVKNSALTSTGLVPFMERYSNSTREVAQDGRRGALMLSVSIQHPDSEAFIDAKMTEGKVTGANVSVKLTDVSCRPPSRANHIHSNIRLTPQSRYSKKRLTHPHYGKDCAQCVEIGRTRCVVLGYHIKGVRARLLCRFGLPYRIHQSMRRNPTVPVRLLPSARHQPLLIRG